MAAEIDELRSRNRFTISAFGLLLMVILGVVLLKSNALKPSPPPPLVFRPPVNELPQEVRLLFENAMDVEVCLLSRGEGIAPENFQNYPISKRVKVLRSGDRQRLRQAIYQGIANDDPGAIPCYDPDYAIRAVTTNNESMGLIICFDCDLIACYINDRRVDVVGTASDAAPIIEEFLRPKAL